MKFNWLLLIEILVLSTIFQITARAMGVSEGLILVGSGLIGFFGRQIFSFVHGSDQQLFTLTDDKE